MTARTDPDDLARTAADAIQELNRLTINAKSYTDPAQLSATADALANLLHRLPQTLHQIEAGLAEFHVADAIRLADKAPEETSRKDVADQVFAVASALRRAGEHLQDAHTAIRKATGPLSNMGSPWGDDEDDKAR